MKIDVSVELLIGLKEYLHTQFNWAKHAEESARTEFVTYQNFDEHKRKIIACVDRINLIERQLLEVTSLIEKAEQPIDDDNEAYERLHEDNE